MTLVKLTGTTRTKNTMSKIEVQYTCNCEPRLEACTPCYKRAYNKAYREQRKEIVQSAQAKWHAKRREQAKKRQAVILEERRKKADKEFWKREKELLKEL